MLDGGSVRGPCGIHWRRGRGVALAMGAAPPHSVKTVAKFIKRAKVSPKPWPPDCALRKVEELCAIHNANGMIALLFQPDHANRIEKKKGPPFCMYAGGRWNSSAFLRGGKGGTPIHRNKLGRVQLVPGWKRRVRCAP